MNQDDKLDLIGSKLDLAEILLAAKDIEGAQTLFDECLTLMKEVLTQDLNDLETGENQDERTSH